MLLRKFMGAVLSLSLFAGVAGVQVYAEASDEGTKVKQSVFTDTNSELKTVTSSTYEDFYVVPVDSLSDGQLTADQLAESKIAWAAGVYFIPGVGEVALLATGAVVVGGATYYAGFCRKRCCCCRSCSRKGLSRRKEKRYKSWYSHRQVPPVQ